MTFEGFAKFKSKKLPVDSRKPFIKKTKLSKDFLANTVRNIITAAQRKNYF